MLWFHAVVFWLHCCWLGGSSDWEVPSKSATKSNSFARSLTTGIADAAITRTCTNATPKLNFGDSISRLSQIESSVVLRDTSEPLSFLGGFYFILRALRISKIPHGMLICVYGTHDLGGEKTIFLHINSSFIYWDFRVYNSLSFAKQTAYLPG